MPILNADPEPLPIDSLPIPGCAGVVGMTYCPGRVFPGGRRGDWNRNLDADLSAIRQWGARGLVTLMELDELEVYGAAELPQRAKGLGLEWIHLPIVDMDVPDPDFEAAWAIEGERLRRWLRAGEQIVIHCLGGLGRTGTIAARLLVEFGEPPREAVRRVRTVRPGTIQTWQQERYVLACGSPGGTGAGSFER
jgi:ADP-ribosyl-[dinitrogen reductase] hydrolase